MKKFNSLYESIMNSNDIENKVNTFDYDGLTIDILKNANGMYFKIYTLDENNIKDELMYQSQQTFNSEDEAEAAAQEYIDQNYSEVEE